MNKFPYGKIVTIYIGIKYSKTLNDICKVIFNHKFYFLALLRF